MIKRYGGPALIGFILLIVGIAIGFYQRPYKLSIVEKVVYVEKIITKQNVSKDIKTTVTKDKEGNVVTVIEDKSKVTTDTFADKSATSEKSKVVENKQPSLKIDAQAGIDPFDRKMIYGGSIDKRILGPFWVGLYGNTEAQFGIRLGITF